MIGRARFAAAVIGAAAWLGAAGPRPARAEDTSDLESLLDEQVVSSASKQAETASAAPALSTNLTAEDLRRYGIRTIAEAIDFLSLAALGADNLNGGEMGARGVLITGDRGSHFLLLVDGHTVNDPVRGSATFGVGAGIPIEIVDHIEVIVGPGSALYGSNAMLGLINVVTKRARDLQGVHLVAETSLATSLRLAAAGGRTFSLLGREGDVTAEIEYFKQRGPTFSFAPENTGVDPFTGQPGRYSRSPDGTGIWGGADASRSLYAEAPSGIVRVSLGETLLEVRGSSYLHAAPTGGGDFDDPGTADRETRASVDLLHRHAFSTLLGVSARLYGDYYALTSDFITSRGALCPFGLITCDYTNRARGLMGGLELQSSWDWKRDGNLVTVLGGDVRERQVETSSRVFNVATGVSAYPPPPGLDVYDTTAGLYLQQTWRASSKLHFNGGARLDFDRRFPVVLSPRLAANWSGWRGGTVRAAYSVAFRAPSWDETTNATDRRIAAQSLAPERVQSVELTLEQMLGAHRFRAGGFFSHWTDMVNLVTLSDAETIEAIRDGKTSVPFTPGVNLTQYQNVSSVENYGFNAGLDGTLGLERLHYGLAVTGAIATVTEGDVSHRMTVSPQIFGNARIAYQLGGRLPTLALATHVMGARLADHANDGQFVPTPYAPAQAELRFCVSGIVPGVAGLSYRAFANYVTADRGPYVVGPVTTAVPTQPTAQLNPVDQFRTTVALQYEF